MGINDADLIHLFRVQRPFLAPLNLSIRLVAPRRLTSDEAAQLCERDSTIKPTTRAGWEIAPISIDGIPHAAISRIHRGEKSTWHLPLAKGIGLLRVSSPIGSGRALTQEECRQLRSIDARFVRANPAWTVKPSATNPAVVGIFRYQRSVMLAVGEVLLAPEEPARTQEPRRRGASSNLSRRNQSILAALMF